MKYLETLQYRLSTSATRAAKTLLEQGKLKCEESAGEESQKEGMQLLERANEAIEFSLELQRTMCSFIMQDRRYPYKKPPDITI